MASSSTSRKRKRIDANATDKLSVKLSNQPASQLGPILVSYPALEPPDLTPFQCYARQKPSKDEESQDFVTQKILVAGEAESVEFYSNITESDKVSNAGCQYLVAVYNKRTRTVILRPAPLHILTRQVKNLKGHEPNEVVALQYGLARAALGETFGTKKAKANIRAQERNKVDVSAMESVAGHIQDSIAMNTDALPTTEEAATSADNSRLVPPFDSSATDPEGVYPLHNVIPEVEWKALPASALISAKTHEARLALLPYSRSQWLNHHLKQVFETTSGNIKRTVKTLYYISVMLAFRKFTGFKEIDKDKLAEQLAHVPSVVVDGLMARFTETPRGSAQSLSTSSTQTSLLTHMFALCLRVDHYTTDATVLASDLAMATTKVNQLFRSLGCKIEALKEKDRFRLGLPENAKGTKRATLYAPVVFPKPRAGKRRS